jgi:hypothetical protein
MFILFVCLFIATRAICQLSGGCYHCRWQGCKFRPILGTQGLWTGRDLYRATPTATRDLGLYGLIRKAGTHVPHILIRSIAELKDGRKLTCCLGITFFQRSIKLNLINIITSGISLYHNVLENRNGHRKFSVQIFIPNVIKKKVISFIS